MDGENKWRVFVYAAGRGQWAFVAGPRSGTGYPSKQAAQEAAEAALAAVRAPAPELAKGESNDR